MSDGLRIVWDPSIDGGAWPGPLAGRRAAAGEAWLGPLGLLARLETELGLGALHASALDRAAELVTILAARVGWWRASYDADPIGTCQRLLHDRDLLAMWGWRGEPASERLAELWSATVGAPPGLPDRLTAVIAALAGRAVDIAELVVRSPLITVEPLWAQLFAQLADAGVRVRERTIAHAPATGDLIGARARGFMPTGDGSLTLLRPHGALAAADEVAATLAALTSLDGVVVIGADDVLDAALARHGLPRLGTRGRPPASLALLRLVIEAAFEPMDPADLHGLLCASPGPVPRRVASRLIRALRDFPSRRSPSWGEALAEGLARCDETWRDDVAVRLTALLAPATARSGAVAVAELDRRLAVLATWARSGIMAHPTLAALAGLAGDARALLAQTGSTELTLLRLRRLCDDLDRAAGLRALGDAGLAGVADPGALLAPARIVVWWSFTRDSAPASPRLRLSLAERAELARIGVTPPDLGGLMEGEAARWRRPLELATEALVLVCPTTTTAGEPAFPHPLWDELCAAMPEPAHASLLEARQLVRPAIAARRTPRLRALPVPTTTIRTGAPLALRDRESPSSIEKLLGCPMSWALHYHGRLYGGLSSGPSEPKPLLFGTLAHALLAKVFAEGALDADAAAARARALADGDLVALCESLALPRYQVELTAVRHAIIESARTLGRLLTTTGATVRGVELDQEGELEAIGLTGTIDLVLSGPDVVLDLKWGRTTNRDKLVAGAALQLAMYAELVAAGGPLPEVGYFTLQSQELFTPQGTRLPEARVVGTATSRDTWHGALVTLGERRAELARGILHAPAADRSEHASALAGGRLTIAPACGYCDFGGLCGQSGCS